MSVSGMLSLHMCVVLLLRPLICMVACVTYRHASEGLVACQLIAFH